MRETILGNLEARFQAYADLIEQTDDHALQEKLDVEKHKSLAEHLWCVVGARESYAKALVEGQWLGFSCSLAGFSTDEFAAKLKASARAFTAAVDSIDEWTDERDELLARLAEHEVMHEGQIIRHLYGVGRRAPDSWPWA